MEKVESVQYSPTLAITGAWRGMSREQIFDELGFESLDNRKWCRRLTLFYKITKSLTSDYTRDHLRVDLDVVLCSRSTRNNYLTLKMYKCRLV